MSLSMTGPTPDKPCEDIQIEGHLIEFRPAYAPPIIADQLVMPFVEES